MGQSLFTFVTSTITSHLDINTHMIALGLYTESDDNNNITIKTIGCTFLLNGELVGRVVMYIIINQNHICDYTEVVVILRLKLEVVSHIGDSVDVIKVNRFQLV